MVLIICIAKQFPGRCWYNYDRAFRLHAAASSLTNWSQMNSDLYHYHTSVAVQTSTPPSSGRHREPRGDQHATTICKSWNSGACSSLASFVDFATDVTGVGAEARTAASIATNPHANERVVPVTSLDGIAKPNAIKDGVFVNFPRSSFLNKIFMPSVSSVTPIKVDNLALQLCNHPDRQKVDYVLNGYVLVFALGFAQSQFVSNQQRQIVHHLISTRP